MTVRKRSYCTMSVYLRNCHLNTIETSAARLTRLWCGLMFMNTGPASELSHPKIAADVINGGGLLVCRAQAAYRSAKSAQSPASGAVLGETYRIFAICCIIIVWLNVILYVHCNACTFSFAIHFNMKNHLNLNVKLMQPLKHLMYIKLIW